VCVVRLLEFVLNSFSFEERSVDRVCGIQIEQSEVSAFAKSTLVGNAMPVPE